MKNAALGNVSSAGGATSPLSGDSIEKQFLDLANMNPMDRMRAGILKSMGLTEDDVKNMSPQQQQAVEQKIREMIEQEFQKNTDKKGQLVDVSA
jgi:basic membrane lipoprotein Med (substrate-binding protein (PBP1-ABC) superfamily)